MTAKAWRLNFPWQDRNREFSWAKALTFALMFAPGTWLIYEVMAEQFGPVPLGGMTYWSGLWATALLMLALAVTPAVAITGWGGLLILRRMIGVTALAYAVAHVFIYFALRFWNFASIAHEMATRLSLILATIATAGMMALGITSTDAAIARMGGRGWQRLHNAIYAIACLALVHYLMSPDIYAEQYLMAGIFFWLMGWRVLKRRGLALHAGALALLALAACAFTALLQFFWIWAFHDYTPAEIVEVYFTLALGIPAMWKILLLGLLIALVAAVRQALTKRFYFRARGQAVSAHSTEDTIRRVG